MAALKIEVKRIRRWGKTVNYGVESQVAMIYCTWVKHVCVCVCLPTFNTAAAHPQTASICLQGRLAGKLVSRQVAKNKHVTSKCAHNNNNNTLISEIVFQKGFKHQGLQHTHTFFGGSTKTLIPPYQKSSFSFVDWSKHFLLIQLVNSNLIKATWEVFILLLQQVLFHI